MVKYNVSFIRNGICQSNLAEAGSREDVEEWFAQNKPDARVLEMLVDVDGIELVSHRSVEL